MSLAGVGQGLQGAEMSLSETNLIPKNISLWDESMLWSDQLSVSSGLGYNNNVWLSAFHPHRSAFVVNDLDWVFIRLPLDGWQVTGSVSVEDTRFWHEAGTPSEDSLLARVKVVRELAHGWQAGWEVRGLYEKQVLDVSLQTDLPYAVLVEGESFTAQPSLRKDWNGGGWLQLEMPVSRWWLASPLDDDWEFGPVLTAGHDFGARSEITLSYSATYQDHNAWQTVQFVNGNDGPGFGPQKLVIFQQQTELAWWQYWDAHQRWRSSTGLVFADLTDNGNGFFNEDQYQVIQDLRWQTADWLIKGAADLTYEAYPVQWTGSANGQTLWRDLWDLSGAVERRLYKGLKVYAKLDYQRAISNYYGNAGDYQAVTVSGGLRWEF